MQKGADGMSKSKEEIMIAAKYVLDKLTNEEFGRTDMLFVFAILNDFLVYTSTRKGQS